MSSSSTSFPVLGLTVVEQERLRRATQRGIKGAVLTYHELSPTMPSYRYSLSCHDFETHVQLAVQLGNEPDRARGLTISFDDGHISNYVSALPLLEKHSCKAIFFVIAGKIDQDKDFMTWAQLRELVALGHRVEGHSWSHLFLTHCSDQQLDNELRRSKEILEDRLGTPVETLSAPHGRWDRRVLRACSKAGYRKLYVSSPWPEQRFLEEIEVVGRLMVSRSMDVARLLRWVTMSPAEAVLRRSQHAMKNSIRQLLGDDLYHRIWTSLAGAKYRNQSLES